MLQLTIGMSPALAGPTPMSTAAPSKWNDPLPGYGLDDPPLVGPLEAFSYIASPHLLMWADLDPPTEDELLGLKPREEYLYGTVYRMFAEWDEKYGEAMAGRPAAEVKAKWRTFVRRHVAGVDSNSRGVAYAEWLWGKLGIAGSPQWIFDQRVHPDIPVEPDAYPASDAIKRIYEAKDTQRLSKRAQNQLGGYVKLVDATGNQVFYISRIKPIKSTLNLIRAANEETKINKARAAAGLEPVPAIVVRLYPAIPQPVARPDPDHVTALARRGIDAAVSVPPTGGDGIMMAPGAGQHPVDGALGDAITHSPDSPEEAAFSQEVTNGLGIDLGNEDLGADAVGGVDFATLELRYVSDTYHGGSGLAYAFSAEPTPENSPSYGGQRAALLASDAFFVWMALPTSAFTVNLNPDEPERIMDTQFSKTDAGRVLLEADLQMKKTVAKLIHPESPTGKPFWTGLDGEKCVSMRQWIVPAPAVVHEDQNQLYIIDAPLSVKMETEVVNSVGVGGMDPGCPGQTEADTKRNETLFRALILPQVEEAVNNAPEYADLRRVYVSRVAAEWYRERSATKRTAYSDLIDQGNVDDWTAREPWSPIEVWQRYVRSYTDGEFTFEQRTERGDVIEIATYVYGGVDLTDIPRSRLSGDAFAQQRPELPSAVGQAPYTPVIEEEENLVWLGGQTTARPLTELQVVRRSPTSAPAFWILTTSPFLLWIIGGALLLVRRRVRAS
ncbi:hypothetical protein [Micromonospora sp. Llam0]|uniref:hypothetical protein n=1 Tax=Micromonospora sp. Llam0 TaxID=2485143 RepID=UPI0011CEBD87|nr:hypothetical protein [Micromonospora sp. Llam0]